MEQYRIIKGNLTECEGAKKIEPVYKSLAITQKDMSAEKTDVSIPGLSAVEAAKEFVDENKK